MENLLKLNKENIDLFVLGRNDSMEDYSISKEVYNKLRKKYNLKVQVFSGVWCHNCTNNLYKVVKRNNEYYYECINCGVLDNEV